MKLCTSVSIIFTFLVLVSIGHAQSLTNQLRTGAYGNSLLIAVNLQENIVSGMFNSSGGYLTDEGWNCNFYFSGKVLPNGSANIVAVSTGSNKYSARTSSTGTLVYSKSNDAVIIKLNNEISECMRGEDILEKQPEPREFSDLRASLELRQIMERKDGIEYRIISTKRSYFYDTPNAINHKKAFVTYGDIVMITEKDKASGRVKSIYKGKKKTTEGWLSEKDLLVIGGILKK